MKYNIRLVKRKKERNKQRKKERKKKERKKERLAFWQFVHNNLD
jgi:hypothetical protein